MQHVRLHCITLHYSLQIGDVVVVMHCCSLNAVSALVKVLDLHNTAGNIKECCREDCQR